MLLGESNVHLSLRMSALKKGSGFHLRKSKTVTSHLHLLRCNVPCGSILEMSLPAPRSEKFHKSSESGWRKQLGSRTKRKYGNSGCSAEL